MQTKVEHDARIAAIHSLRVNLKSLTAEARIIRQEEQRAGAAYRPALAAHRRGRLRREARLTHLALAFVRGRPYRSIEARAKDPVDVANLTNKIVRHWSRTLTSAGVQAWLEAE